MKREIIGGKEILVFDDCEELKWYYHDKFCHGDTIAGFLMEYCNNAEEANEYAKRNEMPYRVKKTEET